MARALDENHCQSGCDERQRRRTAARSRQTGAFHWTASIFHNPGTITEKSQMLFGRDAPQPISMAWNAAPSKIRKVAANIEHTRKECRSAVGLPLLRVYHLNAPCVDCVAVHIARIGAGKRSVARFSANSGYLPANDGSSGVGETVPATIMRQSSWDLNFGGEILRKGQAQPKRFNQQAHQKQHQPHALLLDCSDDNPHRAHQETQLRPEHPRASARPLPGGILQPHRGERHRCGEPHSNDASERHTLGPFWNHKVPFCIAPIHPRLRDHHPHNQYNEQRHVPSQSRVAAVDSRPQYKAASASGFAVSTGKVPSPNYLYFLFPISPLTKLLKRPESLYR